MTETSISIGGSLPGDNFSIDGKITFSGPEISLSGEYGISVPVGPYEASIGGGVGISYSPQGGLRYDVMDPDLEFRAGVPGHFTWNTSNENPDFKIDSGIFSLEHEWERWELPREGTVKYKVVGKTLVVTEINGREIPNAVEKSYVTQDVLGGGYISHNATTTPMVDEFKADLEAGVDPYQARQNLFDKLIAAEKRGATVFRVAPPDHVIGSRGELPGSAPPGCFAPGTVIHSPDRLSVKIEEICVSSVVASFSHECDFGRGKLRENSVSRIYKNITDCFIRLDFSDGREPLHVTPGHLFLDETGGFTKIGDLLRLGGNRARLIDADGGVVTVTGEWIHYSEETADMFERASTRSVTVDGNTVFKEEVTEGWRTYNFEVEGLHTYIAGGIRVHNESGLLGWVVNKTDDFLDDLLGAEPGGFIDKVTDAVTSPFHFAGEIIDGAVKAGQAIGEGFSTARERLANGDVFGAIGAVGTGFHNAFNEAVDGFQRGVDAVGSAIGGALEAGAAAIGGAISAMGRAASDVVDAFAGRDPDHDGKGSDSGKPVIIDLDGDGVEINVNGQVSFDMDGDGYKEKTHWVDADDGFLVVDFNADGSLSGAGDGKITQTKELVLSEIMGSEELTDLQVLSIMEKHAAYGGNNNGVLNAGDALWQRLKVWQDLDQDGEVDAGEMKTLSQVGIKQINLKYDDGTGYSDLSNDVTIFGNSLLGSASYIKTDGTVVKGGVGDVALSYNAQGWRRVETVLGYEIQFEAGGKLAIAELEGKSSANVNLDAGVLDGAIGDARNNLLTAFGHTRSVRISGGDGSDTVTAGMTTCSQAVRAPTRCAVRMATI